MKQLFIVRGVSGSGKSTLAESITWANFSADQYFEQKPEGYSSWSPTLLKQAHEFCQDQVLTAMKHNIPKIAVANTFTRPKEFKAYEVMAEENGYQIFHIVVENRHGSDSVHNVPQEAREKQHLRLKGNLKLI